MVTQQPIFCTSLNASHATATEYIGINSRSSSTWSATEIDHQTSIPTNGKFVKINIKIDTAPGTGNSYQFALSVNGTASGTLVGSISNTDTTLTVIADQSISAGDLVSLESIPTSTPTTFSRIDANFIWEPTIDDEYLILGGSSDALSPSATEQINFECSSSQNWGGESDGQQVVAAAGVIKKFHAVLPSTPGASASYTFSFRRGFVTPGGSPTVTLDNADFDKIDTTNTVSVAAGDAITLRCVPASTPNALAVIWSCVFVPTTSGEIPILGGAANNIATSTENNTFGSQEAWTSTLANVDLEVYNETITLKAMYIELNGSPGSGTDYDFDVLKDGVVQAGLNINIADAATSGNATGQSIDIVSGEKIALEVVPTSTAFRDAYWGLVFTFAAAPPAAQIRSFVPMVIG